LTRGGRAVSSSLPLLGCRVVVTRAQAQASRLDELLTDAGATVLSVPTIQIADPPSLDALDAALRAAAAGSYEWVAFLSVNSVAKVLARLGELSLAVRARVVAVGRATATALSASGVVVQLIPERSSAAGVAEALGEGRGRVLVPRAENAPADALDALRSRGWQVDEVVAYRTELSQDDARAAVVRAREFDVVTFTSGSTAEGLAAMVTPAEAGITLDDSGVRKVVCIGPSTAEVASGLGFRVDAIAAEHSSEGLTRAVIDVC
jgi:uroporphyrinogen-III synthase